MTITNRQKLATAMSQDFTAFMQQAGFEVLYIMMVDHTTESSMTIITAPILPNIYKLCLERELEALKKLEEQNANANSKALYN